MTEGFTDWSKEAKDTVFAAGSIASERGSEVCTMEHLLMALIQSPGSRLPKVCSSLGLDLSAITNEVSGRLPEVEDKEVVDVKLADDVKFSIDRAYEEARSAGSDITIEHLFLGALGDEASTTVKVLTALGVDYAKAKAAL